MSRRKTTPEFIKQAVEVHGGIYNYSQVCYIKNNLNIKIICKTHGVFLQTPITHLRGAGCPKCAINKNADLKRLTSQKFLKRLTSEQLEQYDYSDMDYRNGKTKIKIRCKKHGYFEITPENHIKGEGCKFCHPKRKHIENRDKLNKEFLENNFIDENGYIKLREMMTFFNFRGASTAYKYMRENNVKVKHYFGETGFNPNKPAVLYYIKDLETGLYKVGITNKSLAERFGKDFCSKRTMVLLEQTYENGQEAYLAEQEILEAFKYYRCTNESWPEEKGGKTEFFKEDILEKIKEFNINKV